MQTFTTFTNSYLSLIFAGLIAFLILPADKTKAQTAITNIENSSDESVFTVFEDGGLLGLGEFGTGVIPTEGDGTRLMWYPSKAAFRAGRLLSSNYWDDGNIGNSSVAMGFNTTASGSYSMAIGQQTVAATEGSFSIGIENSANRTADNTLFVAGNSNQIGNPSDALVLDKDAGLVVKGEENVGSIPEEGAGTRMMWYPAKAAFRAGEVDGSEWDDANIGNVSVAMGRHTTASGNYSTAMGNSTEANGNYSTAMGDGTEASGNRSVAMGLQTRASSDQSTAMGEGTIAANANSLTIGRYNSTNASTMTANKPLFVVGNGTSTSSTTTPSDALVLDDAGDMTIAGTLTESSDRRLKKNITPLEEEILDKLDAITPSQFQFKNKQTHPAGPQIGLIAQEVQKQFPELVSEANNGYLSVSYSKFTAVLLKGMQEQQQKIKNQQTTIDQLKKKTRRIAALEKQVSEIKQNRQMAGLPVSTLTVLFAGMVIGGGFWWRSRSERVS